jgi:hypothetical protein
LGGGQTAGRRYTVVRVVTAEEVVSLAELHADLTGLRTFIVEVDGELSITTQLPEVFLECVLGCDFEP